MPPQAISPLDKNSFIIISQTFELVDVARIYNQYRYNKGVVRQAIWLQREHSLFASNCANGKERAGVAWGADRWQSKPRRGNRTNRIRTNVKCDEVVGSFVQFYRCIASIGQRVVVIRL